MHFREFSHLVDELGTEGVVTVVRLERLSGPGVEHDHVFRGEVGHGAGDAEPDRLHKAG